MRIRRGERIICLTQQIARRAVERPVLVVGGGEIRFRLLKLRRGIGRVDAQRREEVFPHEGGHILPGDGFDDRARDARAEVGIGVLAGMDMRKEKSAAAFLSSAIMSLSLLDSLEYDEFSFSPDVWLISMRRVIGTSG